jgi:hypothetical protein
MNRTARGIYYLIPAILLLVAFLWDNSSPVTAEPSPPIPILTGLRQSPPANPPFIDYLKFSAVTPPGAPDIPLDDSVEDPYARYYHIPGTMFNPVPEEGVVIDKAYGGTYGGNGCIYINNLDGRSQFLVAPVDIPDGARIVGIRLFFYDFAKNGDIFVFFDRLDPDGLGGEELAMVRSQDLGPNRSSVFEPLDHVVDHFQNNYEMIALFQAADDYLQLCGVRIMYYPSSSYYLPLISHH